jgi:hypothetical protein
MNRPGIPPIASREQNRARLHAPQSFAEQQDADQDVHQRIDVVAETRLKDQRVLHGPDVDQPVQRNQHGRKREQAERAGRPERSHDFRPLTPHHYDRQSERHGPQHAMREHLGCRDRFDDLEIDRQKAPQRIGDQRREQAFPRAQGVNRRPQLRLRSINPAIRYRLRSL